MIEEMGVSENFTSRQKRIIKWLWIKETMFLIFGAPIGLPESGKSFNSLWLKRKNRDQGGGGPLAQRGFLFPPGKRGELSGELVLLDEEVDRGLGDVEFVGDGRHVSVVAHEAFQHHLFFEDFPDLF